MAQIVEGAPEALTVEQLHDRITIAINAARHLLRRSSLTVEIETCKGLDAAIYDVNELVERLEGRGEE